MADWSSFGQSMAGSAANLGMNMLGNAVSGLINNLFYKRNLNLQVEAQKSLMDYQNEYNAPSAQMQRLEEAGLNPNLVYGSAAPSGQSGNASSPSGVANPGASFSTPDVVAGALRIQQMEQSKAQENMLNAQASYFNAMAERTSYRYQEVIDQEIQESTSRINKIASDIKVNKSQASYNMALSALAVADEAYKRGEIDLQKYRGQQIIAQTMLFMNDAHLKSAQYSYVGQLTLNEQIQFELLKIQKQYDAIMKSTPLAEKQKEAQLQALKRQIAADGARIGIDGSKAAQWSGFILEQLGRGAGIAGSLGIGFGGVAAGLKSLGLPKQQYNPVGFR